MKSRAKSTIYASAGVREYWIVNLIENQFEIYTNSDGRVYQHSQILAANETLLCEVGGQTLRLGLAELFVG